MDCFVFCVLLSPVLLSQLLTLSDAQTMTPTAALTGCAGPPALCCPGENLTCYRGCFCDEFCLSFRDCCEDYISTCREATAAFTTTRSTVRSTSPTSATNTSTAPDTTIRTITTATSTTSASTVSTPISTTTAFSQTLTTATTTPAQPVATSASTEASTTTQTALTRNTPNGDSYTSTEDYGGTPSLSTVYGSWKVHLTAYVLSNDYNEDLISQAVSRLLSQIFHQQNCEDCVVKVKDITAT